MNRVINYISDLNTKYKVVAFYSIVGLLPVGFGFFSLSLFPIRELYTYIGILLAAMIVIQFPVCNFFSEILALRNIKRIDHYCDQVKQGDYLIDFELPPEKGDENDFVRLKRNLYWMGQIIDNREKRLIQALRDLRRAQDSIMESIEYASHIQNAMLPREDFFRNFFQDYFIWWSPRDVVGGDTYWLAPGKNGCFVGVIDCTGHGIPGAFVTLIVHTLLKKLDIDQLMDNPAGVLESMNQQVRTYFGAHGGESKTDEGFDAALCFVNPGRHVMTYAGARMPLFYESAGEVHEIKGDRSGVGYLHTPVDMSYTNRRIDLDEDMSFYLISDGFTDQVGGEKNLPFGKRRLKRLLADLRTSGFARRKERLVDSFREHMSSESRRDDITVLSFSPKMRVSKTAVLSGIEDDG